MATVEISREESFSAAHRLHNSRLNDHRNRELFGKCNNPNGHGHNYRWRVTLRGTVDSETGMVYNLASLKQHMREVMDLIDHKNLDKDVEYFGTRVSTTENLVVYLWQTLECRIHPSSLIYCMTLHETDKHSVTYYGPNRSQ